MSPQVASYIKHLPTDQGTSVRPSGRLPSSRTVPGGSEIAGIQNEGFLFKRFI